MQGWIKLYRQITENDLYFSERFTKTQAWIDLLLLASHMEHAIRFRRGVRINLKPGDLCYSQQTLAERWQWNFKSVRSVLDLFQEREMVEFKTTNVTTVISIKNWDWYQRDGRNGEQNGETSGEKSGEKNGE